LRRIVVLGTTGAGKTAISRSLARRLDIPHVELDALRWDPDWTEVADDVFRDRVAHALAGEVWVSDGNYGLARDLIWPRATHAVWLTYPFRTVMGRLLWRTIRRIFTREELWNGNRERFLSQFASRDSILLWALQTHWSRSNRYEGLFARPEYSHIDVVRLRSPGAARRWLQGVGDRQKG
jgi:adenylate kinase family enzyme